MAISYVNSADLGFSFSGILNTTFDTTGADLLLIGGWGSVTDDNWSSVTFNGESLTRVAYSRYGGNTRYDYVYILQNPPQGNYHIEITDSTGGGIDAVAVCYSGTNLTGQPDSFATQDSGGSGPVTSETLNTTTVADNCWLVMFVHGMDIAGAGTTKRVGSANNSNFYDSNGEKTPPGLYGLTGEAGGPTDYGAIILSIKPLGATVTNYGGGFIAHL